MLKSVSTKQTTLLAAIMAAISITIAATAIVVLYDVQIEEERLGLLETVQSQARLIEAVARFNQQYPPNTPFEGSFEATLSQITEAHENFAGFRETGEFTLARQEGADIVFLINRRNDASQSIESIPIDAVNAEPMRRALRGESGTIIGPDYRGVEVLAAYEPVAELSLGIVAKIDMAELQAQFINTGLFLAGLTLCLIVLGAWLFSSRIIWPMIRKLEQDEVTLRENEELLEKAQRLAQIGHWRLNPLTGHVSGSSELYRIFDLPLGAVFDSFSDVVHPDDKEMNLAAIRGGAEHGKDWDITHRLICQDGKERWVHAIGEAVTDESGNVIELMGTVQNITEYKMVEEELQKMLKLNSLGVLAGGIAHDFNNILTMLLGNISLAKSQLSKDHPGFKNLEKAETAFNRATNLTNQLLTFAKGGDPVKENICLSQLIEEVTRFNLTGSNVKFDFEADEGLWIVKADAGQMEQVFANLVINSKQAMPKGGHLTIAIKNVEIRNDEEPGLKAGKYVLVTVKDEGIGMERELLGQIFDPYFSTKSDGSGLGLATVFSILTKHGVHINVESEPGKGTSFSIFFPRSESQQLAGVEQAATEPSDEPQSGKILVMDDEEGLCDLAKQVLEGSGYSVDVANEGAQAIGMYKQSMDVDSPYDCLILDLTIPGGIGGKDVIGEILKINPEAKAIVSSGYADDPVMANYTEYGFKEVLLKPFTLGSMIEVVRSVLSKDPDQA